MNKLLALFLATVITGALSSCNKKIKEDLEDLESSVADQKSKNESLQNQVNELNSVLINTPITFNFSTNSGSSNVSIADSYSLSEGSAYVTSYFADNGNGTYYVHLHRINDLDGDFGTSIRFTYHVAKDSIISPVANLWGYLPNGNMYELQFGGTSNITHTLKVNSFSSTTGSISFSYSIATTALYGGNLYNNQPMNFSTSFSGTLVKGNNNT
ncbi:MAG: hypothetical protein MUF42_16720 [Cytophagaceae bacterium]|jgi:hypothetical protein|nr:hypothetical protein [Cytophagaceae bacterium]